LDGRIVGVGSPGPVFEKVRSAFAESTVDRGTPF
jgi:hypothetical protein